jgi:hypothetical protein
MKVIIKVSLSVCMLMIAFASIAVAAEPMGRFNAALNKQKIVMVEGCTFLTSASTWHDVVSDGVSDTLAGIKDAKGEQNASPSFFEGKALIEGQ